MKKINIGFQNTFKNAFNSIKIKSLKLQGDNVG